MDNRDPHLRRPYSSGSGAVGGRGRGRGGRGGRGRGARGSGDRAPKRPVILGFKALQDLDNKQPDEIILDLTSSRCFPAIEALLQQSDMRDDMIVLTTSVLAKACGCSAKEYLFKLLNLLPTSFFLTFSLRTFLNRMHSCRLSSSKIILFFKDVIRIMNELLLKFPNCYASLPLADLYCGIKILADAGKLDENQMDKNTLLEDAEELFQLRKQKEDELKKREEEKQPRRRRGRDCKTYFEKISAIFSRCYQRSFIL